MTGRVGLADDVYIHLAHVYARSVRVQWYSLTIVLRHGDSPRLVSPYLVLSIVHCLCFPLFSLSRLFCLRASRVVGLEVVREWAIAFFRLLVCSFMTQ
jgi:hypothetical protein